MFTNSTIKRIPILMLILFLGLSNITIYSDTHKIEPEVDVNEEESSKLASRETPTRSSITIIEENEWGDYPYPVGWQYPCIYYDQPEDQLFICGEPRADNPSSIEVMTLNVTTGKWGIMERSPQIDLNRFFPMMTLDKINRRFFLYSGQSHGAFKNDLWMYEIETNDWVHLKDNVLPEGRKSSAFVYNEHDGCLYIHMGLNFNNQPLGGFYKINTQSPYQVTPLEDGSNYGMVYIDTHDMCVNSDGTKIFTLVPNYHDMFRLWEYDIQENTWNSSMVPSDFLWSRGMRSFFRDLDSSVNTLGNNRTENLLWTFFPDNGTWMNQTVDNMSSIINNYGGYYDRNSDSFFRLGGQHTKDLNILTFKNMTMSDPIGNVPPSIIGSDAYFFENEEELLLFTTNKPWELYQFERDNGIWSDPIHIDRGTSGLQMLSNPGICFDPYGKNLYILGGSIYGQFQQVLGKLWRINLSNYTCDLIFEDSILETLAGSNIVFNPNDKMIYGFGGYRQGSSGFEFNSTLYRIDTSNHSVEIIETIGDKPRPRWGASIALDEKENDIYLFGGGNVDSAMNDLWKFSIDTGNSWELIDKEGVNRPVERVQGRMVVDNEQRDLYLIGGNYEYPFEWRYNYAFYLDDVKKFDLISKTWKEVAKNDRIHGTCSPAVYLDHNKRELWLYGDTDALPIKMFKMDLFNPKLFNLSLENPTSGDHTGFSMLDTYELRAEIQFAKEPYKTESITLKIPSTKGSVFLNYSKSTDNFSEEDPLDLLTLEGHSNIWNGNLLDISLFIRFHWNFSSPSEWNTLFYDIHPVDLPSFEIYATDMIKIRNKLEIIWGGNLTSSYHGNFKDGWISDRENITINNIDVIYAGTKIEPPAGTFGVELLQNDYVIYSSSEEFLCPFDISFDTSGFPEGESQYHLKLTGVPQDIYTSEVEFTLNLDIVPPSSINLFEIYPDELNGTMNIYDDDRQIYLKWLGAKDNGSGIGHYLWSFKDGGGTTDGTRSEHHFAEIVLPNTGWNTIYVWPVDMVGNIGQSSSIDVFIDEEGVEFEVLSPDVTNVIPYVNPELEIRITDIGGSNIDTHSIKYRFTRNGKNDISWTAPNVWKDVMDAWSDEMKETITFKLQLWELSEEPRNFIQFKVKDGTGNEYFSNEYAMVVDQSLLMPKTTLLEPPDGAKLQFIDQLELSWSVEAYDDEMVTYDLYFSEDRRLVEVGDHSVLMESGISGTSYSPSGLEYGTYYWKVVPIFEEIYVGTCTSGVFEFTIEFEDEELIITSDIQDCKISILNDGTPFTTTFDFTNSGYRDLRMKIDVDCSSKLIVNWDPTIDPGGFDLLEGQTIYCPITISAKPGTKPGFYDINLNFSSEEGPFLEKTINVTVREPSLETKDNEFLSPGMMIAGIISIILMIIVIVVIGFIIVKRSEKIEEEEVEKEREEKTKLSGEHKYDNLEKELEMGLFGGFEQ